MTERILAESFEWDQIVIERDDPIREGFVALCVIANSDIQLIGTAFIVAAEGNHSIAITAAHCFEQIRKIVEPNQPHHPSALQEFLPLPKKFDFSGVKGIYITNDEAFVCQIEIAVWDRETDLAVLKILAPDEKVDLFQCHFLLDNNIPKAGEEVLMIGYGEMKVETDAETPNIGRLQFRPVVRVGRVEAVHVNGHFMLKTPCIETSIAIFGGMSGGVVARWSAGLGLIKPFALISHAPEPQPSMDRSQSGHSVGSVLKMKLMPTTEGAQVVSMRLSNIGCGQVASDVIFPFTFDSKSP